VKTEIAIVDQTAADGNDLAGKLQTAFPQSEIMVYNNPLELLKASQRRRIDMLFTDLRIRPIDGYELIKALRQTQSFFVYVVSGSREHPDNLDWMNINGYFPKPVSVAELTSLHDQLDLECAN
jgi:CheY-like chemotaxis protein